MTRFCEEVWNRADPAAIPELFHLDCAFRGSLGAERRGHQGLADYVREVTAALDGYRSEIEALVVEDGRASARMRFSGRHTGPFLGFAPTGAGVKLGGRGAVPLRGGTYPVALGARGPGGAEVPARGAGAALIPFSFP